MSTETQVYRDQGRGLASEFLTCGCLAHRHQLQVRLDLYREAQAKGISPSSIDAGYELNGWHNVKSVHAATCIGACRCIPWSLYCFDNSYRILMSQPTMDYELVKQVKPSYWLADGPPLSLVRRR
jgi:hypothetical protein